MKTVTRSFTLLVVAIAVGGSGGLGEIRGRPSVIDGDTLEVHGQRIRLAGIDAPESRQTCTAGGRQYRCGQKAALFLDEAIAARPVVCLVSDKDRYGRAIATCSVANEDLGAIMVAAGWAVAYRRYSRAYVAQETEAAAARRGIWAGTFVYPWDWRAQNK